MSGLSGKRISDTFTRLLKLTENTRPEDATITEVEDGSGNRYQIGKKEEPVNIAREKLLQPSTLYVNNSQGSDSNDGRTSFTPFFSISKALQVIQRELDLNGYRIAIAIAEGDYSNEGLLHLPTLVGANPETCNAIVPNPQVLIYGEGQESTAVYGFELDHQAYYSIGRVTAKIFSDISPDPAFSATRGGILEVFECAIASQTSPSSESSESNSSGFYYSEEESSSTDNCALYSGYGAILKLSQQIEFQGFYESSVLKAESGGRIENHNNCRFLMSQALQYGTSALFIDADRDANVDLSSTFFINDLTTDSVLHLRNCYVHLPFTQRDKCTVAIKDNTNYGYFNSERLVNVSSDRVSYENSSLQVNTVKEVIDLLVLRGKTRRQEMPLSGRVSLNNTDSAIQTLVIPQKQYQNSLEVTLPSTPVLDKHFALINLEANNLSFKIGDHQVLPGDRYEIIYDGVEWVEL